MNEEQVSASPKQMNDLSSRIIDYEMGLLDTDECLALFQELVDTGLAWKLQGHYGRTAKDLLVAGLIKRKDSQ